MFKFGFTEENNEALDNDGASDNVLQWDPATEIFLNQQHFETLKSLQTVNKFNCSNIQLSYIANKNAIEQLGSDDSVIEAERLHSDLLPAKYEGGFKIWECTQDLADFLLSEVAGVEFGNKLVLDLGCGAGLLGVLALCHGASVHFQDYNTSVLNALTIPNILLNVAPENRQKKLSTSRFFAGDWGSLVDLLASEGLQYDYILASETIYNAENYHKLCALFKTLLSSAGVVFVAAKTYYFGVGGGMRQFEEILKKDGTLTSSVCWKCSQGVQREILKLTFKDCPS